MCSGQQILNFASVRSIHMGGRNTKYKIGKHPIL
jgi:hypothetical protein